MRRLALMIVLGIVVMPAASQTPPSQKPSFEVVSVRPNTSGQRGGPPRIDGGRFIATNTNLRLMVQYAFNPPNGSPLLYSQLNDYSQLVGLPSWAEDFHFDIQAKVEDQAGPVSRDEMRRRLQSILEDRFQLRTHWEHRQQLVYNLVVIRPGKLKLSEDQTPAKRPDTSGPGPQFDPKAPLLRGDLRAVFNASGATSTGKALQISDMVGWLRGRVNRPVYDKTSLKGLFDIQLTFTVDSTSNGPLSSGPATSAQPSAASTPRGPSLFTALQEQLGLKLESSKGPVDVLVIDSVQRPTEN
jgi:uncharacterized protein (TIGR03435 family)